jgi:plastocyanin
MKFRPLTALALAPLAAMGTLALAGAGPAGASSPVKVTAVETEFHIALSKKAFTPGKYSFKAENKGSITHALSITGPGLKNAHTHGIAPGKSATLTVTFKKGKYDIFCPESGHKAMGMNVNVVVGSTSKSSSSSSSKSSGSGGYGY